MSRTRPLQAIRGAKLNIFITGGGTVNGVERFVSCGVWGAVGGMFSCVVSWWS